MILIDECLKRYKDDTYLLETSIDIVAHGSNRGSLDPHNQSLSIKSSHSSSLYN